MDREESLKSTGAPTNASSATRKPAPPELPREGGHGTAPGQSEASGPVNSVAKALRVLHALAHPDAPTSWARSPSAPASPRPAPTASSRP